MKDQTSLTHRIAQTLDSLAVPLRAMAGVLAFATLPPPAEGALGTSPGGAHPGQEAREANAKDAQRLTDMLYDAAKSPDFLRRIALSPDGTIQQVAVQQTLFNFSGQTCRVFSQGLIPFTMHVSLDEVRAFHTNHTKPEDGTSEGDPSKAQTQGGDGDLAGTSERPTVPLYPTEASLQQKAKEEQQNREANRDALPVTSEGQARTPQPPGSPQPSVAPESKVTPKGEPVEPKLDPAHELELKTALSNYLKGHKITDQDFANGELNVDVDTPLGRARYTLLDRDRRIWGVWVEGVGVGEFTAMTYSMAARLFEFEGSMEEAREFAEKADMRLDLEPQVRTSEPPMPPERSVASESTEMPKGEPVEPKLDPAHELELKTALSNYLKGHKITDQDFANGELNVDVDTPLGRARYTLLDRDRRIWGVWVEGVGVGEFTAMTYSMAARLFEFEGDMVQAATFAKEAGIKLESVPQAPAEVPRAQPDTKDSEATLPLPTIPLDRPSLPLFFGSPEIQLGEATRKRVAKICRDRPLTDKDFNSKGELHFVMDEHAGEISCTLTNRGLQEWTINYPGLRPFYALGIPPEVGYRLFEREGNVEMAEALARKAGIETAPPAPPGNIVNLSFSVSESLISLVKEWEGFNKVTKRCPAGVPTIGYGHTGKEIKRTSVTEQEADVILRGDLRKAGLEVQEACRQLGILHKLTQKRYDALVSFAFNLGGDIILAGCKKTCTDLRNALRREDHTAVAEKFKEFIWAYNEKKGRKEKMRGLIKRRNEEAKLFLAVDDTLAGKPRDPKVAAK